MRFDIVTIFPAMVEQAVASGIVGRAIERGALSVVVHDLRAFTTDRHRVVDDVPYGGGPGMVLKAEPIFRALDAISAADGVAPTVILTSPQGAVFTQREAERLSRVGRLALICGRYEGVDERVRARVDEEVSAGDYVLSGGELPALIVVDAVARHIPGVVGDAQSVAEDSFSRGLLDFPHYTRPATLQMAGRGPLAVPEVLLSGDHGAIRRWRKREAIRRTLARRPELLETAVLDEEERQILRELRDACNTGKVGSLEPGETRSTANGRD
jgi:tRNA (guanine37-N1)-methyltransferase